MLTLAVGRHGRRRHLEGENEEKRESPKGMGASPLEVRLADELRRLNEVALRRGLDAEQLEKCYPYPHSKTNSVTYRFLPVYFVTALVATAVAARFCAGFSGVRCLLPNNYMIWEATRPISDCAFCAGVTRPTILRNATRESFQKYAYSSGPIIVKGGIGHWKAMSEFDFDSFKRLYETTEGAYESVEDGCQFLHFRSDLFTLREVFAMSEKRAKHEPGQEPWYVGWVNCHPRVLAKMREYYTYPEFLPEDAELPNSENVFFGYERGAVMHLDYIPRLMWQGQIKGNKTWKLAPIPECDDKCKPFQFYVEPGDAVLLDTRIWYHATDIPPGQFSLTVQSEYG